MRRRGEFSEAEVEQFDRATPGDEDVVRLEVAVDDARVCAASRASAI